MRVKTVHGVMLATLVHRRPKKPPRNRMAAQRRCVNADAVSQLRQSAPINTLTCSPTLRASARQVITAFEQ